MMEYMLCMNIFNSQVSQVQGYAIKFNVDNLGYFDSSVYILAPLFKNL